MITVRTLGTTPWENPSLKFIAKTSYHTNLHSPTIDWDELPADIKAAFKTLGYTKTLWKHDKEPDTSNYDYDELTESQKTAAAKIGYTKETWDKEWFLIPCSSISKLVGTLLAADVLVYTLVLIALQIIRQFLQLVLP